MNYSEMVVRWEGILDRSVLAFHHLCFICGVLAFLWAASLPFAVSASPGLSEIVGGVLAGGVVLGLADAFGVAFRYAIFGDIKLFPSWTLTAYLPVSEPVDSETSIQPDEDLVQRTAGEGVSGLWDVEIDSSFGAMSVVFHLVEKGGKLTGSVEGSLFKPMQIEGGAIEDGLAQWKTTSTEPMAMTLGFVARFTGDQVSGEADFGEHGQGQISGARRGSKSVSSENRAGSGFAPMAYVERRRETIPVADVSPELRPVVEELGLEGNCRQLVEEGWTIIENAVDPDFVSRLRRTLIEGLPLDATGSANAFMLLGKDPVYAEAVLNPKVLAMAEFSVGRGSLLGSLAGTIRSKGAAPLELHSDQELFPAPFPEHNMMLTACWVLDDFTHEAGATRVVPGSHRLLRHPMEAEAVDESAGLAMECSAGSIAFWDGRVWHGNTSRTIDGQRVALHASYYRLLMRPGEDYSDVADDLIATYGQPMSTLLGREDFLYTKGYDYVNDYARFTQTTNNSKS
ncbi:MAG: hypothetical protein CL917_07435 [Deltaproteobacteria bacterium]|nr:hypothetical protein [Deltaproteobacteria bacterium]